MPRKSFAVIGMGRFGIAVTEELIRLGCDVLVIDRSNEKIDRMVNIATHAVSLDTTDKIALKEVGIQSIDHVIVAIGKDVESSILTTLILSELNVKHITVKVTSEYHSSVVKKVGAHEVILPEQSSGRRLAKRISSNNMLEYYELGDCHSFIVCKVTLKIVGISIIELDTRNKYGVNVVALRQQNSIIIPTKDTKIEEDMELLLVGNNSDLDKFRLWLNK